MDKKEVIFLSKTSNIELQDRKKLVLTGVKEVINFNEEKIILNTMLGKLSIKGKSLKVNKLDVKNGDVIIEGYIISLIYSKKVKNTKKFFKIFSRKEE